MIFSHFVTFIHLYSDIKSLYISLIGTYIFQLYNNAIYLPLSIILDAMFSTHVSKRTTARLAKMRKCFWCQIRKGAERERESKEKWAKRKMAPKEKRSKKRKGVKRENGAK